MDKAFDVLRLPHLKARKLGPWFRFCIVADLLVRGAVYDYWNMAEIGPLSPLGEEGRALTDDWIHAPALKLSFRKRERLS